MLKAVIAILIASQVVAPQSPNEPTEVPSYAGVVDLEPASLEQLTVDLLPRDTLIEFDNEPVSNDKDKAKTSNEKKAEKLAKLNKAAAGAYKGVFYDNDFSYLSDEDYEGSFPGDHFKQLKFGPTACPSCRDGSSTTGLDFENDASAHQFKEGDVPWTLDIGGQYRYRFHGERNMRGLGLTGRSDEFLLHRTRLFANLQFGKRLRFYGEYLDAVSEFENFAPRPIEENRSDILNLFVDGTLVETDRGKLLGRIGRQELLYGAQRAISPLDWANTRRTFDGGKLMWQGEHMDVDGFWVKPLRTSPKSFDNPSSDEQLYGVYSSYNDFPDNTLESYWLAFDDDATGFRADSIGGRFYEEQGSYMTELWGNYQFGTNSDDSRHQSGAWTVGIGRKSESGWKPTWWVYYDWASGDDSLATSNGYFHFYPLAHKYLGFMDLFGRRNIESPNALLTLQPTEKLTLLTWYHYFFLQDRRDSPYSVVMTPFFPSVTPSSANLGHEIDMLATYKITPRTDLMLGYSHFFSGSYYDTPGLPHQGDADFVYTQFQVNF